MKYLILLIFLFPLILLSYNQKTVKTTLRSAAEEVITKSGFSLLSETIQDEALKEQGAQTEDGDCIDDSCLMDTGKMLAAQRLFLVRVSDLGKENYMFKITHINLETNEQISVRSEIYTGNLSDTAKLFNFSKKFLSTISKDGQNKGGNIPAMLQLLFEMNNKANDSAGENKKYFLTIKSKYDPVNIYDGKNLLGISPLKVRVKEGFYTLTFVKEGYEVAERKIKLIRNLVIKTIPFKESIVLTVKSDLKEGTVYLDDADTGDLENGILKIKLAQGEYNVSLKMNGYDTVSRKITLNESKTVDFGEVYKTGGPYPITIKTKIKSKVFINDKFIAYTPVEVRLKKATYKLNLYNELAGNKTYQINVLKSENFYYKMNNKFSLIEFSLNSNYLYTNFPFQRNSSHFLIGFDIELFKWSWEYLDFNILGGGFYIGLNNDKIMKLHLLGLDFKPIQSIKINFSIGPFLGDFINLYDNIQDSYMTFGGIKLEYNKFINNIFYIKAATSVYYGTKNSKDNFYSDKDDSMDNGFIFSTNLGIGLAY